jgi:bifunctional DNA-binding transcriptional regulator/antitoxin component of YhaV-PrlF toxin-antitoxin module
MCPDEPTPPAPDDFKAKLLEELKQQIAGEMKELKKELAASVKPERKPRAEKEKKPDLPDVEVKEDNAVISALGNLPLPKAILKSLGWGKGDVIELKVDAGKLSATRVGHTNVVPKPKGKAGEGVADGQEGKEQEESAATASLSKYFEFDFGEKNVMGKLKQFLESAAKLYEAGNVTEGFKILAMIDGIELKSEEPDRGKMRFTAIKFLADVLPKHPEAIVTQGPQVMELIKKISTPFLREKAYGFLAMGYKNVPAANAVFEQVLDILFGLLKKYPTTDLFAIVPLLENILKIVKGTSSPHLAQAIAYINENFAAIEDNDYKIRFIKMLTSVEDFRGSKELAKAFKAQTTEGSAERRQVLDALRENRDLQKVWLEKHPEMAEAFSDEGDEELLEELKDKKSKKKPKEAEAPKKEEGAAPIPVGEPAGEVQGDRDAAEPGPAGEPEAVEPGPADEPEAIEEELEKQLEQESDDDEPEEPEETPDDEPEEPEPAMELKEKDE